MAVFVKRRVIIAISSSEFVDEARFRE